MAFSDNLGQYGHMPISESPRSRVDEIRLARGFTNAALARLAGMESSTLHKVVSDKRKPSRRVAERLAPVLEVPVKELYARVGDPIPPPAALAVVDRSHADPDMALSSPDVPVFGSAQAGSEGSFHLNMLGGPIDWARRPPGLVGVEGVFAIRVEGDSMAPWRQPGELVFIHHNRPAVPGCHVIAEIWSPEPGQPPRAFLKRLVRRTATRVELEQYNPPAVIAFEAERVGRLHRVIEWPEALGL
ncbi:MAG TPA: S24 family peptidase [Acetobacteraceae bacterium]|nr:S24 family peptidase [Acetobacteraceae bacterium]